MVRPKNRVASVGRISGIPRNRDSSHLGGDVLDNISAPPRDHQTGALRGEASSDCRTDAGPTTGDHRDLSGQSFHSRQR